MAVKTVAKRHRGAFSQYSVKNGYIDNSGWAAFTTGGISKSDFAGWRMIKRKIRRYDGALARTKTITIAYNYKGVGTETVAYSNGLDETTWQAFGKVTNTWEIWTDRHLAQLTDVMDETGSFCIDATYYGGNGSDVIGIAKPVTVSGGTATPHYPITTTQVDGNYTNIWGGAGGRTWYKFNIPIFKDGVETNDHIWFYADAKVLSDATRMLLKLKSYDNGQDQNNTWYPWKVNTSPESYNEQQMDGGATQAWLNGADLEYQSGAGGSYTGNFRSYANVQEVIDELWINEDPALGAFVSAYDSTGDAAAQIAKNPLWAYNAAVSGRNFSGTDSTYGEAYGALCYYAEESNKNQYPIRPGNVQVCSHTGNSAINQWQMYGNLKIYEGESTSDPLLCHIPTLGGSADINDTAWQFCAGGV